VMGYGGCAEDDDAWYERAIVETELQDDEGLHAIRAVTEPPDDLDLHVVDPLVLQPASLPCQATWHVHPPPAAGPHEACRNVPRKMN
jgi:hypothetical protein